MRFALPHDLVQDAVQETLLRALRGLPRFRGDSRLSTWVYRIAYREGLRAKARWTRQQGRQRPLPEDPATPEGTGCAVEQADELTRLRVAMKSLPERHRLALGYHYLDGLSVQEIGSLMKSSPNTVKSWLKRGRDRLRELTGIQT